MPQESEQLHRFLSQLSPPFDQVVASLRGLLKELAPTSKESIKWRNLHYELNGGLCMVVPAKGYVRLEFFKGARLPDPHGILEGTGAAGGRHVKIEHSERAAANDVRELVQAAISLNIEC